MSEAPDEGTPRAPRFLKLEQVAEVFSTTPAQVYALVRRGDLVAIKLGGRGQWRVEDKEIDAFVERLRAETADWIKAHPWTEAAERKALVDADRVPDDQDARPPERPDVGSSVWSGVRRAVVP